MPTLFPASPRHWRRLPLAAAMLLGALGPAPCAAQDRSPEAAAPVDARIQAAVATLMQGDDDAATRRLLQHSTAAVPAIQAQLVVLSAKDLPYPKAEARAGVHRLAAILAAIGPDAGPAAPALAKATLRVSLRSGTAIDPLPLLDMAGVMVFAAPDDYRTTVTETITIGAYLCMAAAQFDGRAPIPSLVEQLDDDSPAVRWCAAHALAARYSEVAASNHREPAIQALAAAASTRHPTTFSVNVDLAEARGRSVGQLADDAIQNQAGAALLGLDPNHEAAARGHIARLTHPDPLLAANSARMLGALGHKTSAVTTAQWVAALQAAARQSRPRVSRAAVQSLAAGPKAAAVHAALTDAAQSPDPETARRAQEHLDRWDGKREPHQDGGSGH